MQSNVFTTDNDGNLNLKAPNALYSLIFLFHLYIIRMLFNVTYMYSFVRHPYLHLCHCLSIACARMQSVCYS